MNKKLKSIEVGLIGCGDAVTLNASDTATEPIAKYALDKFKAEDQMSFKDNGKEYFVPFHAVDHIYVSESEESVADRPNPYGCEPSGGGTEPVGEVWFTGTFGECQESSVQTQLTETDKANLDDILANYGDYSVSLNGTELPNAEDQSTATSKTVYFANADDTIGVLLDKDDRGVTGNYAFAKCPTDITTVEVTVAHK